jgi:2-hydroxy-6-oxonona-2,4-dienedioate hydrolase
VSIWTDFLGAELRQQEVGGVSTRVLVAGHGDDVVVLLHGRGGHLESWRATVGPLAEYHTVVAFDLLGHGLTAGNGGEYRVADLAAHAGAVLDVLGLDRVTLVGQSIGGWVATLLALERPGQIASLVLVEAAGFESEEERLADPAFAQRYKRGGRAFEAPTMEAVRERLTGLVADPATIDDEMVEVRQALYEPDEARAVHRAVRAADNTATLLTPEVLERLGLPVLVLRGESAHTPAEVVARAAAAASARLVIVADAAQWPQLERPEIVNPLIAELAGTG